MTENCLHFFVSWLHCHTYSVTLQAWCRGKVWQPDWSGEWNGENEERLVNSWFFLPVLWNKMCSDHLRQLPERFWEGALSWISASHSASCSFVRRAWWRLTHKSGLTERADAETVVPLSSDSQRAGQTEARIKKHQVKVSIGEWFCVCRWTQTHRQCQTGQEPAAMLRKYVLKVHVRHEKWAKSWIWIGKTNKKIW